MDARDAEDARGLRNGALHERLLAVPFRDRDAWVDALLGLKDVPPDVPYLPRGSVPYLPCGVDEILAMVREAPLTANDELVDLGSGVGRVVFLAHLLSGARARGVEIQEPLVRDAKERARALGLTVSFVHANAAEMELDGSVFFLYSPFNGEMLRAVLARIEEVAQRRRIVVCTVGFELPDVPWLRARETRSASIGLYDSRSAVLLGGRATG